MTHDQLLDRYAELTVRSGLNVTPGQQVLISAPIEAVALVRAITVHAYKAGATLVTPLYNDEHNTLARFAHGADGSFDAAPDWLFDAMAAAFKGGAARAKNGVVCNPNIPSEEVFTMPHRERADSVVRASKPLSYQGTFIDGIRVRFEGGRIVESNAGKGAETFAKMIATDDGAGRLGEVALVPHSSPISASGTVFNETLFDENAASHIAVGQAYSDNIRDGHALSLEQKAALGVNTSLIHVDWMIGSGELDVDGVLPDGSVEPLMRKGEWAV